MADLELNEDPSSTYGASEEYKAAWHSKYGNAEPSGNASKADWVDYAVKWGASQEEAEAKTATELKDEYSGRGVVSAPAQSTVSGQGTAAADLASGQAAPGGGVNSGTPGGSATTVGTSSGGAAARGSNT